MREHIVKRLRSSLAVKSSSQMGSSRVWAILLFLYCLTETVSARACLYGWMDRPGSQSCYFFSHDNAQKTWSDARLKCTAQGGDLLKIDDVAERNWVRSQVLHLVATIRRYNHWLIGLNRISDGVTWKWADGSPASISQTQQWKTGTNLNDHSKRCVHLFNGDWDLEPCSNTYQSICERPKNLPLTCDSDNGWMTYNNKCYKYFPQARTWADAQKQCRQVAATLPIILDKSNEISVADTARVKGGNMWTGLRAQAYGTGHVSWIWSDGSAFTTFPFWSSGPGTISRSSANSTCVELNHNAKLPNNWLASNCNVRRTFMCQKPEGVCPVGWFQYTTTCYSFNSQFQVSFSVASAYCKGQGSDLVQITNSNVQNFLNPYLADQRRARVNTLWIGLTDNNVNAGPWKWTNGQVLGSYKHWNSPHPANTAGKQDCVFVDTGDTSGKWRVSSDCTQSKSFICQIAVNKPLKQITIPPTHAVCAQGWLPYKTNCYFFNENDVNWNNARIWCQKQGADLVKIKSDDESAFINRNMQNSDYWIGLHDRNHENVFEWVNENGPTQYKHWYPGEPNNFNHQENCVEIYGTRGPRNKGKWNDARCNKAVNFICMKPAANMGGTPLPTTSRPWSSKCGPFWETDPFSTNCYQFSNDKLSWFDALDMCKTRGGNLLSIASSQESQYIVGRIRSMHSIDYWLGANDRSVEAGWTWSDGTPFAFINWNAGEPNDFGHNEDCGAIITSHGHWNDDNCSKRKGFICKKTTYFVCPPGWKVFKWRCYLFKEDRQIWTSARGLCKRQASDLIKIDDWNLLGFVRDNIRQSADWWIGLNDRVHEGRFVWLDETSTSGVIDWKAHEPNNIGNEDCVAIFKTRDAVQNGKYNDYSCNNRENYICQKPATKVTSTTLKPTVTPATAPPGLMYGCPRGWNGFRGSCYKFQYIYGGWDKAVSVCGSAPAHIVSIVDRPENNFIYSMIPTSVRRSSRGVWIGFNDKQLESSFVWSDNSPVRYVRWARGEPNNWQGHDEDCCTMSTTTGGFWYDENCDVNFRGTICKQPKTFVSTAELELAKGCEQQSGGIGYHATCYRFYYTPSSWAGAERFCVAGKGHLATITDRQVQAFIGAEMQSKSSHFWIGLSDVKSPGTYAWSSHAPFTFSSWYETHTGNERSTCVALKNNRPAGLWVNHNCTDRISFICEYPRVGYTTAATPQPTPISTIPCPNLWKEFMGMCYRAWTTGLSQRLTWPEARAYCQSFGGDLASIHNSSLEMFFGATVFPNTPAAYWIGLNDRNLENGYVWSDGSPTDYTNWARTEPNNWNGKEDCVEYNSFTHNWNDFYCYTAHNYICQIKKGTVIPTTTPAPTGVTSSTCGTGWVLFNKACYLLSSPSGNNSAINWFNARRFCMNTGGDLISIHTPDENGFITGLTSKIPDRRYWTGLNSLDLSGYQWTDGTPLSFLSWMPGEPNDFFGAERCVELYGREGDWNDNNCNDLHGFICKKQPYGLPPTPTPTPFISGGCPRNFKTFAGSNRCYYIAATDSRNWTDAEKTCEKMLPGATLAVIGSGLEQTFFMSLLHGVTKWIWIGLTDQRINGNYMWIDSSEVTYTKWAPGQPNENIAQDHIQHRRDCVMVWTSLRNQKMAGGWDDHFCSTKLPYACSMRKSTTYPTAHPNTRGCINGYFRHWNSCYKTYNTPKSWSEALSQCKQDGANLVCAQSPFEAAYIDLLVQTQGPSWIGLADKTKSGTYTWTDGWPVRFTRWADKEPSKGPGEGCVVETFNNEWNDTACSDLHNFICEQNLNPRPTPTPTVIGACPDNSWTSTGSYCYHLELTQLRSWPESRYTCSQYGATLASFWSAKEFAVVGNITNKTTDIWIGLSRADYGGFKWTDGSGLNYDNWASGEPSDTDSMMHQDCVVAMAASSWQWNDLDCFQQKGYICKVIKKSTAVATQISPSTQTGRPHTQFLKQTGHKGLSGGGIAGIVIGVLAVLAIGFVILFFLRRKFPKTLSEAVSPSTGFENALYISSEEKVSVTQESDVNSTGTYMTGDDDSADC